MKIKKNPCLTCGACCAFFRVSFYWSEAEDFPGGHVPLDLTEDVTPFLRAMRGTNQKQPRCEALHGEIGTLVQCSIYEQRPTACREFGLHWEDGLFNIKPDELQRCNRARAMYGLPPVTAATSHYPIQRPLKRHENLGKPNIHPLRKIRKGGRKPGGVINS